ncbi:DUF2797 domain-containing protein [Thermophagus xiamenensis]|uniref:DUF2797 domain-containing protein n=1 Tax=Thermophagus xiamenensis TaxID=385682 RepID=A0A1I1ZDL0_9BACT|nr:DUF2797 domain-containing protein [Thermophagus xiamenensis]SFE29797.1 Protein of unknown function [Thermophagus xiamenensis]
MTYQGNLVKMDGTLQNGEVVYNLRLGGSELRLNDLLGKFIQIHYMGKINCVVCGKEIRKSYGQGFCYECFSSAPEADECILRPDRCLAHLGIARDMYWAENHCLQPHIVYLAISGGLKVGVTRLSQVPYRWIDQGATHAIRICQVPNRHIAGVIETFLMPHFGDKTNWKKMITNEALDNIDLVNNKEKAINLLPRELKRYGLNDNNIFEIQYPVNFYPQNPVQINFDKETLVNGILTGIKGQYLIFDNQKIINVRRHSGYLAQIQFN